MATLEFLPPEIKASIFSLLSQEALHTLIFVSPALSETAAMYLYHNPIFKSTYRFAQFISTVSRSGRHAAMVRKLEVYDSFEYDSGMGSNARWIEWKYRDVPLYAAEPPPQRTFESVQSASLSTHPRRNPFLAHCYDNLPMGSIVQALAACINLRSGFSSYNLRCSRH